MDSIKRRALDQQLNLMVGHADKLSEIVQEGLAGDRSSQASSSLTEEDYKGMRLEDDEIEQYELRNKM